MAQIDLALLTLRFLARAQFLRESAQLFRSASHLLHDTSCFEHRALFRFLESRDLTTTQTGARVLSTVLAVAIRPPKMIAPSGGQWPRLLDRGGQSRSRFSLKSRFERPSRCLLPGRTHGGTAL